MTWSKNMMRADLDDMLKTIKIHPKAPKNASVGSNYDYVFKCGVYYISLGDVKTLILGGRVYGCGYEYMMTFMKKKYPLIHDEIKKIREDKI